MRQFGRIVLVFTGAIVCVAVIGMFSQPAKADPHAVFFTAIGQQQLFFNMLAALDQADYVEPAAPATGLPSGQSREELLESREQAGFSPISAPALDATRTDLASVLTRGITLEGHDLWSAYIAFQIALEASRRSNTDEVMRMYCQVGLGIENCNFEDPNVGVQEREDNKKRAHVVDPRERAAATAISAVEGAMFANNNPNSSDQQIRRSSLENAESGLEKPRPFNENMATARDRYNNDSLKQAALDRLGSAGFSMITSDNINSSALDKIYIDPNTRQMSIAQKNGDGTFSPITPRDVGGEAYTRTYTSTLTDLLGLPGGTLGAVNQGIDTAKEFKNYEETDGAISDTRIVGGVVGGTIKDLNARIDVPAHNKLAATQNAQNVLAIAEQNPIYVPPEGEHMPGTHEFVDRQAQPGGQPGGHVQGARTGRNEGSVAGITADDSIYHSPRTPMDPSVSIPVGIHHEVGGQLLLGAISNNKIGGCGCPPLPGVINDHGPAVMRMINMHR